MPSYIAYSTAETACPVFALGFRQHLTTLVLKANQACPQRSSVRYRTIGGSRIAWTVIPCLSIQTLLNQIFFEFFSYDALKLSVYKFWG